MRALTPDKLRFGAAYAGKWASQRVGEALDRPELARPTQVCAPLTSRCNFGCGFCPHPTAPVHHEMSLQEWKRILLELKDWLGTFRINFLGGEPFLHKDLFPILEFCAEQGIFAGITTNGSALTEKNARRVCELGVFNVSISLDSLDPARHDENRGFKGSWNKIMDGVEHLNRYRTEATRVCFRTTVMEWNVHQLVDMAALARAKGVVIGFQPVEYRDMEEDHDNPEDYTVPTDARSPRERFTALSLEAMPENLVGNWVTSIDVLNQQVERLITLKGEGWQILNSPEHLRAMAQVFARPDFIFSIPRDCKAGWEDLIILPNGSVRGCSEQPTYGNVLHQPIREIWASTAADKHRANCADCTRTCMNMYHWKRSVWEKAAMWWGYF